MTTTITNNQTTIHNTSEAMSTVSDASVSNFIHSTVQVNDQTFTNSTQSDHLINQLSNLVVNDDEFQDVYNEADEKEDRDEEICEEEEVDSADETQLYDENYYNEDEPTAIQESVANENKSKLKFTVTSHGKPKLVDPSGVGFFYVQDGKPNAKGVQMWKCERCNVTNKNPLKCGARVHTVGDEITYLFDPNESDDVKGHNHKPDFSKLERIEYLKLIKENATKDISADPRTVIDNAPVLSVEAAAKVTREKNLIQSIHYARDKGQQRLPTANTRKDLIITDYFRITLSGMLFLFADTGSSDPNRILLFATLANIALMNEFSNW